MKDILKIIEGMHWSAPEMVQGKAIVKASPTQAFWNLWKYNKNNIKSMGVFVIKENGNFIAYRAVPISVACAGSRSVPTLSHKLNALQYPEKLFEYQRPHTLKLVKDVCGNNAVLDGSDTGTGKSFCNLTVAKELNRIPFVICTYSGIDVWKKVARDLDVTEIIIINYEKLKRGKTGYLEKVFEGESYDFNWLVDSDKYILIWDEVHRCQSPKSINAKMLVQAAKQNYPMLLLSATIGDDPMQLKATGFALNLFPTEESFWSWVRANGCFKNEYNGFEFNGSHEVLSNLHKMIYTNKGSRMRIRDLGDAFPDNKVIAEAYTMKSAKEIQKVYTFLREACSNLEYRCNFDGDSHLTELLRARQKVELLKAPTFVEMTKDLLEERHSIIIFVNFTDTIKILMEQLETTCVVWGEQRGAKGKSERAQNIARFMADQERIIICNTGAGGESISLHDTCGKHSRVTLISPVWSARVLKQILGRAHRAGAMTGVVQRLIFAANTVEEDVARDVSAKMDRINLINDGDLTRGLNLNLAAVK